MARQQLFTSYPNKIVAAAATPEQLYTPQKFVCSLVVQGLMTNTDFVYLGTASQQLFAIAPGKSFEIHGDNMDHGGSAFLDISTIYVKVGVNGNGVSFLTCDQY